MLLDIFSLNFVHADSTYLHLLLVEVGNILLYLVSRISELGEVLTA